MGGKDKFSVVATTDGITFGCTAEACPVSVVAPIRSQARKLLGDSGYVRREPATYRGYWYTGEIGNCEKT